MSNTMKNAKARRKVAYNVGITIAINDDGSFPVFNNGLRQNVLFLYKLFKNASKCARVFLLNQSKAEPAPFPPSLGIDLDDVVRTDQVADSLDYVIAIGSAMPLGVLQGLRARGVKLIFYKAGNGAVISMEGVVAYPNSSRAELHYDHGCFDEVWLTPQHVHTAKGWYETIYRCPVVEVPQIWSPDLLEIAGAGAGSEYGYQPGREKWRLGVLDPNITVMKTSHLPMLVIDRFHRENPGKLEAAYITNSVQFKENHHFKTFAKKLPVVIDGIMTFEERFVAYAFMKKYCDAVVTHHWENGLNYLYYEILFGGYPLVHNSSFLKGYGYYYADFDAADGARALRLAMDEHDRNLVEYRRRVDQLIAALNPVSKANISLHENALFRAGALVAA
jgi:hypothetical protein